MNGRGFQVFIEAVLVVISEIITWIQNRSDEDQNSDQEDV